MKYGNIAIIGMSGRFPKSENLEKFHYNLVNKVDCVGKVPPRRKELLKLGEKEYIECGFLDDIEYFDNEYFGIPGKEADFMSPEQRIILELVAETILNAGYSLQSFKGINCGVFLTSSENEYEGLLSKQTAPTRLGSLRSILSGRVAYQFDLRGPNILYDTGCSSSLVALHEACVKLMVEEIDYALVGGISISLDIPEVKKNEYDALGLCSKSFRSKSFDEDADGVAIGEGGGCILLKRFDIAMRDSDPIIAIIECGAINGDGGRSSSVTMPSVIGQKEVMVSAWKDVDLSKLTDIEAHGIGTSIGDSIEAQSIIENMKEIGINQILRLSSVKSNIGHLGYSAGASSIIKVLLELKYNVTYPIVHFNKGNPLIGFEKSNLRPVTTSIHWNPTAQRAIGIDSFGLGGTNAHIVIEKFIEPKEEDNYKLGMRLFKISARSEASFFAYLEKLKDYINDSEVNLNSLLYTLNVGRDDYDFRRLIVIQDSSDLMEKLDLLSPYKKMKRHKVVFCMKLEANLEMDWTNLKEGLPGIATENTQLSDNTDAEYKLKMYQFCTEIGIKADLVLADIQSKAIINYYNHTIDAEKLYDELDQPINSDYTKVIELLKSFHEDEEYLVLDFGFSKILKNTKLGKNIKVFELASINDFYRFLTIYYNNGNSIDWLKVYGEKHYHKISLPGYCFDKIHHWAEIRVRSPESSIQERSDYQEQGGVQIQNTYKNQRVYQEQEEQDQSNQEKRNLINSEGNKNQKEFIFSTNEIIYSLQEIWKKIFGFDGDIDAEEDFFDLGGNSLLIQKMSIEINNRFHIEFDAYEVYENETIKKLSVKILEYI